jgi:iron complex outermembrane receptor protein
MIHFVDIKSVTFTGIMLLLCMTLAASESKKLQASGDTLKRPMLGNEVMLPEVQVEAYNKTSTLKSIPGSFSIRVKSDLNNHSFPSLLPAISSIPGVHIHQGTFNTNRITIRGIGARIPYATGRIRAYFDEVPLTNGSGFSFMEYIDPVFADQVQVVKSPSTGAYGAGMGGTVLIRSKPVEEYYPHVMAEFQAGAWGLINSNLALEEKLGKNSLKAAYSRGNMDGYRENNAMKRQTAGLLWHYAPNSNHLLSFKIMLHEMTAQIPSSIDSLNYFDNPRSAAANWLKTKGFEEGRRMFGSLGHSFGKNQSTGLKTTIFYNISEEAEVRPFDMFDEKRNLVGLRSSLTHKRSINRIELGASAGLEAMFENVHFANRQNLQGAGISGDPISTIDEKIKAIGIFAQLNADKGRNRMNVGLHVHQTFITFENFSFNNLQQLKGTYGTAWIISPRLGISHSLHPNHSLYASVNHGFSPPSLSETLHTDGTINPGIKPEKSLSWDAGWRGSLPAQHSWFDIGLYYMFVKDMLVAERIGDDAWIGRNAGKGRHYGLEAEIKTLIYGSSEPTDASSRLLQSVHLHLNAQAGSYIFTDFVDRGISRNGKLIPGIPTGTSTIMLLVRGYKGIFFHPSITYTGRVALNDGNTKFTEPYVLLNVRAGFKQAGNLAVAEIYLQANNITNTHYASMILVNAPGLRNQRYYYPGLPIHLNAGINIRWNYRQTRQ